MIIINMRIEEMILIDEIMIKDEKLKKSINKNTNKNIIV